MWPARRCDSTWFRLNQPRAFQMWSVSTHGHTVLQASAFKLMGNFTLFGMVEIMCEVRTLADRQQPSTCCQAAC